jgi:FkbM family methyltransferase
MISQLARLANDCYHILRGPSHSKAALFQSLLVPGGRKMGFRIQHFDNRTAQLLYREIFVRQYYHFVSQTPSPVILDCGANVGMASIYFKWLYPKARIRAFEPDPTTFKLFQTNLSANQLDVEANNCALWDENGELDFYVDSSDPGSLLMSTDPSRAKAQVIKVPARKLSDFIDGPIDFLKLDVEGAEHRVLHDLVETGKLKLIRQLAIEYHHRIGNQKSCLSPFLQSLEGAGFEYQIHAPRFPVTSNSVFQDMLISASQ